MVCGDKIVDVPQNQFQRKLRIDPQRYIFKLSRKQLMPNLTANAESDCFCISFMHNSLSQPMGLFRWSWLNIDLYLKIWSILWDKASDKYSYSLLDKIYRMSVISNTFKIVICEIFLHKIFLCFTGSIKMNS